MLFLIIAIALTICAIPVVRAGETPMGRLAASGFTGTGVILGFIVTIGVASVSSPLIGFGFIVAVILHELCAARAVQIIGHDVARVRLIPLPPFARPRSDRPFEMAIEESFAALYAPALSIIPMILCFGVFYTAAFSYPQIANVARILAIVIGTFNFMVLLPFLPFAGGRVVRAIADSFWPKLSLVVTVFISAAFASAAISDHSIAMAVVAVAGFQSIFYKRRPKQSRLSSNESLLVLATYAFCLTVHFTGGWWLLTSLM